jgi:HK97 family phage portal protein
MFFSRPKASLAGDRSVWGDFWFSPVPGTSLSTPDKALALTAVYACVKVLAESFAVMPVRLFKPSADGKRRAYVRKHWLVRLFTKAPNRFQTPFEWRMMLMGHLALRGNAFCQITSNGRGEITELLPLHPDRMSVEMLKGGEYRYKYVDDQGQIVRYARGEIWHLRGLSSDGILGLSPIQACRGAVVEGLAMQAYGNNFYQNDAKPGGGWIEFDGKFANTTDKQDFRDSWQKLQGGANRGKVAILEKGMKFHELGVSNTDSQFVESRAAKVTDIARIFRVPPHKIADLTRATFSNIEQQDIEFWNGTMLPWAEAWESSIEFFLLGEDSPLEVEFDMRRMMRGDSAARAAYLTAGIQWGYITRNEAREMEGLEPLDNLDTPIVPLNMVPADKLGEDEEPEPGGDDTPPPDPAPDDRPPGKGTTKDARLATLIAGNAARMARRITAGSPPDAETLAQALAIDPARAAVWLAAPLAADVLASLLELAS